MYETVVLPANKFDKYGNVSIPKREQAKPTDEYYYVWNKSIIEAGNPEQGEATMWRDHISFFRAKDSKLLGEDVSYARRGGEPSGPWHPSSYRCPSITSNPGIERQIFLRAATDSNFVKPSK